MELRGGRGGARGMPGVVVSRPRGRGLGLPAPRRMGTCLRSLAPLGGEAGGGGAGWKARSLISPRGGRGGRKRSGLEKASGAPPPQTGSPPTTATPTPTPPPPGRPGSPLLMVMRGRGAGAARPGRGGPLPGLAPSPRAASPPLPPPESSRLRAAGTASPQSRQSPQRDAGAAGPCARWRPGWAAGLEGGTPWQKTGCAPHRVAGRPPCPPAPQSRRSERHRLGGELVLVLPSGRGERADCGGWAGAGRGGSGGPGAGRQGES